MDAKVLDETKVDVETPSKALEEEKKEESKAGPKYEIIGGGNINLLPTLSKEEIVTYQKKDRFNYSGLFIMILLTLVTIGVFGFNIINKQQLNAERAKYQNVRNQVLAKQQTVNRNYLIADRIAVFNTVEENTYSPREVLTYWTETAKGYGTIKSIKIDDDLKFTITGTSNSLSNAMKLWHILLIDKRVSELNLNSIAKVPGKGASFSFAGQLDFNYFLNK